MTANHYERFLAIFQRMERMDLDQAPVKQIKLSMPQVALLRCIARYPGSHAQQVAGALGLSAPTISVGLRKLEEEGWLRREPDPADGRAMRHFLTDKALNVMRQVKQFRQKKVSEFLDALTNEEQEQLLTLLEKAVGRLEQVERVAE